MQIFQGSFDLSRIFNGKVTRQKLLEIFKVFFVVINQNWKVVFFLQVRMAVETIASKKTHKTVKEELLNTLKENNLVEEASLKIENVTDPGEAIAIINGCEEIIKT